MKKNTLFLLPPGFVDNDRREFCPECAELWGVLHYYPALKETVDICYVELAHPRAPISELLGDGRWNAPTLVFNQMAQVPATLELKSSNNHHYLDSARTIAKYFAELYGIAIPRGS